MSANWIHLPHQSFSNMCVKFDHSFLFLEYWVTLNCHFVVAEIDEFCCNIAITVIFFINSLQMLADKVMKEFIDADLSRKQHERVKLHVTLMNTLFRDNRESREGDDAPRLTFDARSILRVSFSPMFLHCSFFLFLFWIVLFFFFSKHIDK